MAVYRENPLYLSLEDPMVYSSGGDPVGTAVPLYSVPHRGTAPPPPPLYSIPRRSNRATRHVESVYAPFFSSRHRSEGGGGGGGGRGGGERGGEDPSAEGRHRRRVRYTRTRVTMSVRHRPSGADGDGDGGQPSPPRRLQSRWNPTLVRWTRTVRQGGGGGAPGRRSPSPTGRRAGPGGGGAGTDRSVYGSVFDGDGRRHVVSGSGGPDGRGNAADVVDESRGRARTVTSRAPQRSSSLRSGSTASVSLSPPRLVTTTSSPDRVSSFRRGCTLRRSGSLKSEREPGYRQQIDSLRRRLLARTEGISSTATSPSRRPSEVLLAARRPVSENVFTVQDRAAEAAGWAALLNRAEQAHQRGWGCLADVTDGGVKIEEIVDDGGDRNEPRDTQGKNTHRETHTHTHTHTHSTQRTEEVGDTTAEKIQMRSHEETTRKTTVHAEKTRTDNLMLQRDQMISSAPPMKCDEADGDIESTDPGVTSPTEDVTSPAECMTSAGAETRRSLIHLSSAAESGDSDRTLSVEVAFAPAARDILRLDGRVREKVEAIEAAELERELEQEFEAEYEEELRQELEQELQERLDQELDRRMAPVSGQYDNASGQFEDANGDGSDDIQREHDDHREQADEIREQHHEKYEYVQQQEHVIQHDRDIHQEHHEERTESKSRAVCSKSQKSDSNNTRQGSPSASGNSGDHHHHSLPVFVTHAESRQSPERTSGSSPGRGRRRRAVQQTSSRLSDTPPRSTRSRRATRSDSEDEEALRRRERGWNAPQPRSRSVPRAAVTTKDTARVTSVRVQKGRERDASTRRRSASSPPADGKSPSGRTPSATAAAESPRTGNSSKTSSVCSSSVSSPSKGTSRGWRHTTGRSTPRTGASSSTVREDRGSRERVFSPPSSLARPSRPVGGATLRPALSSPSLVASSTAGCSRPARPSVGHSCMSTAREHVHYGRYGRQHAADDRHGVVRARSFSSRPAAPPRGRPLTRAASARAPGSRGAGTAPRTGRGDVSLRSAHAASHANAEQMAVRRQLSPYRSSTLPRTVSCGGGGETTSRTTSTSTTTTTKVVAKGTTVASVAAEEDGGSPRGAISPRRSASLRSPRKVLSTSTETGYDSMEASPPLRSNRAEESGGRRGGRGGIAADDSWFRAAAYVPMLKTRLSATETALRFSGGPPQGVTATLTEKFENLERLVSAMEEREERDRRAQEDARETSPVREAIDHFERFRSTLSSPDLTMKSPPLVRGLSASLCRDLHRVGHHHHQEEMEKGVLEPELTTGGSSRRCRPLSLSLSLESLRSQREVSPSPHLDPSQYRRYVLRLLRASRASPHFKRLQRHYHSLERLMELEKVTETCSKPGPRTFPSYETWRRIRVKERALAEMKKICEQLDEAQRRREFYSRVSCRSGERWRGDRSLERRQKSVENLKRKFDAIVERERQELAGTWHGTTAERGGRVRRSLSSLSPRQMEGLRDRLNGIYGSQTSLRSESVRSHTGSTRSHSEPRRFVDVTAVATSSTASRAASLHVRPASEPEPRDRTSTASAPARADSVHQMRTDQPTRADPVHRVETTPAPDAAEQRRLSLALSREVAERFAPRGRDTLAPARSKSASPAASAVSPRTCYSVDLSEEGEKRTDAHEFMLVLTPERSQSETRPVSQSASQSLTRTRHSSLTRGERQQLLERSERLREKRLARLRRPLSVPSEEEIRSSISRSSSAQTVVEREAVTETGGVPRAVYHWERETAAAAAEAERHHSQETRFNSLPCPLRPGGGQRRFLSPEYLPERSASSVDLGRRGQLGENDTMRYADDFHRAFDDYARSRSASPVGRGWSYSPPRRRSSCSPPRRYGPPVRVPSVSPPRLSSPPPPPLLRRGYTEPPPGEVRRIRQLLETGRGCHRRPVPAPRLSKASSLPQLTAPPVGSVRSLTQRYEESQERQEADAAAAAAAVRGGRARSWSPPRNLRQLGAYISRTRILGKIVELQRRLRRPTTESEELEDLRSFVERERETLMRVRRGQVDRLKRQLQGQEERAAGTPRRSTSSPSLSQSQSPNRMHGYSQIQAIEVPVQRGRGGERRRDGDFSSSNRMTQNLRRAHVTRERGRPLAAGSRSPIGQPGVSLSPIGRQGGAMSPIGRPRQFRPISGGGGGGGRSQSEISFSERPLITSTPLPCVPARPAPTPSPGPAHTQPPTNQRSRWAGEPRDWSIHRPVGRYVPPTRSTSAACRRPAQLGFQPYAGSRRWHCDGCAVRAYNRWRTRKRNVTWKEPVIGPIAKSMSTSAISERRVISPQRGRRDDRDAAGGEQWRAPPPSAEELLEEERRRRHLQERQELERRRHGDHFTPAQKSPIPLNRYDNLFDDVNLRSSRGGDAKMAARALHGFRPINNRELSFNKGDTIFIRRQVDRNWLEGELNGRIGIFPVNYVQVVPIDAQRGGRPKLGSEGQARARYSFAAQTPVELSLKKGDLVTLLRRVDSNWYEGRLGSRTGIFPTTYVEVLGRPLPERIETSAKPCLTGGATSAPGGGLQNQLHVDTCQQEAVPFKALYSYAPQNDDELALSEGDVVYVIEKCEDGWFVGTNGRSGLFGTFPGNYVQES